MKETKIKYFMNLCFFMYFAILLAERITSVSLSIANGVKLFDGFNTFVYLTIFMSVLLFLIYVIIKNGSAVKALFVPNETAIQKIDFTGLVKAGGILLLSGMVHSEYTISPLQFASYGFYITAIILQAVLLNGSAENKRILWLSVCYVVAFSMAIPVSYRSNLDYAVLFHIVEGITTYLLVGAFTCLSLKLFGGKTDLFSTPIFLTMIIADALVVGLRISEEVNYFVLISAIISVVFFVATKIYAHKNKNIKI